MKEKIEERQKVLKGEFDKLAQELKNLDEQIKLANRRRSEIQMRQVQLNGSYSELDKILDDLLRPCDLPSDDKEQAEEESKVVNMNK